MIRSSRSIVALAALALGLGAAHAAHAQTAYIVVGGTSLASFNLATPGAVTTIGNLSGAVSSLNDIDFRVANGLLYGYNQASNQIVTINTTNAVTTFVANSSTPGNFSATGIDFNPMADRLRIVNRGDQNLRVNVAGGAATIDGTLAYVSGDPNFGVDPNVNDVAYTNNDNDPATGTTLYYIDSGLGTLASTTNPNGGALNTIGSFGATQVGVQGFDIFTGAGGSNTGYLLTNGVRNGQIALNTINLSNASLSFIGNISASGNISGFAITPVAVPEPGSVALFVGLSVAGAGLLRKRRARK